MAFKENIWPRLWASSHGEGLKVAMHRVDLRIKRNGGAKNDGNKKNKKTAYQGERKPFQSFLSKCSINGVAESSRGKSAGLT